MKKIDASKSLIFSREFEDLKNSLEYLGQEGYFSNSKDFSEYEEAELDIVRVGSVANLVLRPYTFARDGFINSFSYFIPKSEVVFVEEEPKEKTLRQFKSIDEFFEVTGFKIGDIVKIKKFGNLNFEETAMLTGIRLYIDGEYRRIEIYFGSVARSFSVLFEYFKYFKNGEWVRFGVEE